MDCKDMIRKAKICMWTYLLIFEALKIFGFDFVTSVENMRLLKVFDFIDNNLFLCVLIPSIFCVLSQNILYSMFYENYRTKWKFLNIYIIIYAILLNIFQVNNLIVLSTIISLLALIVPFIICKNKSNLIKVIIVDNLFNIVSVKTKEVSISNDSTMILILYQIDYYIMLILYKIGGFEKWEYSLEQVGGFLAKKLRKLKEKSKKYKNKLKNLKNKVILKKSKQETKSLMNWKIKLKTWSINIRIDLTDTIIPVLFIYIIFLIALFVSFKEIESILFMIPFALFKKSFNKSFHADHIINIEKNKIIITCAALSSIMYVFAIINILPIEVSLLSGIVVAFCFDWFLWVLKDWIDLRSEVASLKHKSFAMTTDGIQEIFRELKTPMKYREYFKQVFIDGVKDVDYFSTITDTTFDEQQYRNAKSRFKKRLEKLNML